MRICKHTRRLGHTGFTLIEGLIVIIVMGTLATLSMPRMQQSMECRTQLAARDGLDELLKSARMYRMKFGTFPERIDDPNLPSIPPYSTELEYTISRGGDDEFEGTAVYLRRPETQTRLLYNANTDTRTICEDETWRCDTIALDEEACGA
jgi:prepilin-type N-terminal cleavage/methylation domain-containing protein